METSHQTRASLDKLDLLSQDALHRLVVELQNAEFPGEFDAATEMHTDYSGSYFTFAPSHFFRETKPTLTGDILCSLRDGASLLSVGSGAAYTERLLVSGFGISPEQIELVDIDLKKLPDIFRAHEFDMHQEWPELGRKFDFVVFFESTLININFDSDTEFEDGRLKQRPREEGLRHLLDRTSQVLNPGGVARVPVETIHHVNEDAIASLSAERPELEFSYSPGLGVASLIHMRLKG